MFPQIVFIFAVFPLLLILFPVDVSSWGHNRQFLHSPAVVRPLYFACGHSLECGSHAICGVTRSCHCKLGCLPASDGVNCTRHHCAHNYSCREHFGNRTKCQHDAFGGHCTCASEEYLTLDEYSQKCTPKRCYAHRHCSEGMFCYEKKCRCRLGNLPASNGYECTPFTCLTDDECSRFDYNAKCFRNLRDGGICLCKDNFSLDPRTHLCIRVFRSAGSTTHYILAIAPFLCLVPTILILVRYYQKERCQTVGSQRIESIQPISNALSRHQVHSISQANQRQQQQSTGGSPPSNQTNFAYLDDQPPSYDIVNSQTKSKSTEFPPPTYESLKK